MSPRTADSGDPVCERFDCTAPAVVILADPAGDRMNVCPDHHQEALRVSDGLIRGIGLVPRTRP